MLVLGIVLSISRGGALAGAIGLLFLLALLPDRIPAVASALTAAGGSAILVVALLQRSALRNELSTSQAVTQRGEMLVLILVVCAGVALVQSAISLWARFGTRPAWMAVSRRRAAIGFAGALAMAVALAIAAGLPGALSRQWRAFKQPNVTGVSSVNAYTRFGTATGSHRYQYWQAAIAGFHSSELHGIGPGTFEFWWARHNSVSQFVRNAHSLYIETLAELGIVGALQVVGLFGILLVLGTVRALRAPPSTRYALAVAVAAFAVFAVSAAYDWVWQLAVLPAAALLLGGGIVSVRRRPAQLHPAFALRNSRGACLRRTAGPARDRDTADHDHLDSLQPERGACRQPGRRDAGREQRPGARALCGHPKTSARADPRVGETLRPSGHGGRSGERTRADQLANLAGALTDRGRGGPSPPRARLLPPRTSAQSDLIALLLVILERPELSRASEARIRRAVLTAATERWRPAHLRSLIFAYAVSGSLLLALAAMGLAGVGPLAF